MRTLLAILNHVATAHPVLAAAGLLAQRLPGARLDALHVRPASDPSFMPSEEVMTPQREARFAAEAQQLTDDLRGIFDAWRNEGGSAASWREEAGVEAELVARESHRADLVIIGQAQHAEAGDGQATITAALFETPPPVLLVPPQVMTQLGTHIAIAWKPSDTAERAVISAMPLLRRAERVTILIGQDEAGDAAPTADWLRDLPQPPALRRFTCGGHGIGRALLREAGAAGADLLVMGAYAHRRTMELLFGGATREVLAEADLPVFLHH